MIYLKFNHNVHITKGRLGLSLGLIAPNMQELGATEGPKQAFLWPHNLVVGAI